VGLRAHPSAHPNLPLTASGVGVRRSLASYVFPPVDLDEPSDSLAETGRGRRGREHPLVPVTDIRLALLGPSGQAKAQLVQAPASNGAGERAT
jgi:hypothetical protein